MSALFASGRIIDAIVLFTLVEATFLTFLYRRTSRGVPPGEFLANLISGVALLLGIRTALTGGDWTWTALCLIAAFTAHLIDLGRRWNA